MSDGVFWYIWNQLVLIVDGTSTPAGALDNLKRIEKQINDNRERSFLTDRQYLALKNLVYEFLQIFKEASEHAEQSTETKIGA